MGRENQMPGIVASFRDEREAKIDIPATNDDTVALASWLSASANEGYYLKSIAALTGGHQRDPYTVGAKIVLSRKNA